MATPRPAPWAAQTPEERAAWEARVDARLRELRGHIERITAELAAKKRPT